MTDEEKEVVEWLKQSINEYNDIFQGKIEDESGIKRMKTIKNLIEKQQKELDNKDKIINAMAEQLAGLTIWNNKKEEPLILMDKQEVIDYFTKKVTKEENK